MPRRSPACRVRRGVAPRHRPLDTVPSSKLRLIGVRKASDVYANLRPARAGDIDLLISAGARRSPTACTTNMFDTCEYHPVRSKQPRGVARRGSLVSVDKAGGLDTSRM